MNRYLAPIASNIFVTNLRLFGANENLANTAVLAAIFALILDAMVTTYLVQT